MTPLRGFSLSGFWGPQTLNPKQLGDIKGLNHELLGAKVGLGFRGLGFRFRVWITSCLAQEP